MGWYTDIGLDLSGRKNKKSGIGVLGRLHGSFTDFARADESNVRYKPSRYFAFSTVFQVGIQVANVPMAERYARCH